MLRRGWRIVVLALAVAALAPRPASPQPADLSQVLRRLAQYIADYGARMSLVIGTERYTQEAAGALLVTPGDYASVPGARRVKRTLVSEFALVRVNDDWLGFRDVYEVDGAPVRDRTDRLRMLFLGSPSTAVAQWRRIADESARFNVGDIQRNFNTPTTALFFLGAANQPRFSFKKSGEETVNGVPVWTVSYEERQKPTIIRTSAGKNVPVSGTVLVDPATGRVFSTTMKLNAEVDVTPRGVVPLPGSAGVPITPRTGMTPGSQGNPLGGQQPKGPARSEVSVTVSYAPDARVGMLVPIEMREMYLRLEGQRTDAVATYNDFKRFETDVKVLVK